MLRHSVAGGVTFQKEDVLKVFSKKRLPNRIRLPETTFWLSALRARERIPIAPPFQFRLGRRIAEMFSSLSVEIASSSAKLRFDALSKSLALLISVGFFGAMLEIKIVRKKVN